MKFTIFQNTRIGPRASNQDRLAYSYSKDAMLLVVADGMGGHDNGDVAAEMAVQMLVDAFQKTAIPSLTNPSKFLADHIQHIHDMLFQYTEINELLESPRTTIVAAIVQFGTLYTAHVGDSRLYHYRDNHLLFRTEDHSVIQDMFNKGLISKAEMPKHPYRNKVYSCLGGFENPDIALAKRQQLEAGDTVLLCTDGVWGALNDDQIRDTLSGNIISHNITKLLDLAETSSQADGDNMTAIGLQWGDKQTAQPPVSTGSMPLGETTTTVMQFPTDSDNESETHIASDSDKIPAEQPSQTDALLSNDITDDEIEKTIAEIQAALSKSTSH